MAHRIGTDRNQLLLLPPGLDEYIDENNPVKVIDVFVDSPDLKETGFKNSIPDEKGCPPYNPGDLLKLYLYGYLNRIRSSRKLEKECTRNIEVIWLLNQLRPRYRTIAYFREHNSKAIKSVFRQFVVMMKKWDLIAGDLLAVDGSKFRAVNSKRNNYNQQKIQRHLNYIHQKTDSEISLIFLCYNLKRVMYILGIIGILKAIKAFSQCFGSFLNCFSTFFKVNPSCFVQLNPLSRKMVFLT